MRKEIETTEKREAREMNEKVGKDMTAGRLDSYEL